MSVHDLWQQAPPSPPKAAQFWNRDRLHAGISRRLVRYVVTRQVRAGNTRPLVSFAFDDVPASAFVHGAPVLESLGVRGTYYVAGGLCGTVDDDRLIVSAAECAELHRRGHEIGCHTFSHVDLRSVSEAELYADLDRNRAFFASVAPGLRLDNFAYPFGSASLMRKLQIQRRFVTCRGVTEVINAGSIDLGMLKAVGLIDFAKVASAVDEARRRNGWLILFTHDVAPAPTAIGCTPALLRAAVERALEAGCEVVTVREAARRIGAVAAPRDHGLQCSPASSM
jgi:peptidoglycan/xylan/chitin deacetylase (PgdA/CDA1 family)